MTKPRTQKKKIARMTKNRQKMKNLKNKTTKTVNLKKVRCSPKDKNEMNEFTCYTDKNLYKLRDLWNARHPDVQIMTNDPKEIHADLTKYMSNVCSKESCWLKQNFMDNKTISELTDSFAPVSPKEWKKNPNEWLSSIDIMKVMKQYEKAYKCFDFIGPTPIDFDTKMLYGECVWDELCNFSLSEQIKKGKTKIGIIFNTDPHDKPGQHWISMFINIKKKKIFFFDSVGDKAPKEIMVLVNRIIKQGKKINMNMKFDQNHPVEHQYGDTECGVYSLFFISHMLEDKFTEHYMKTHILKDDYMQKFRKVYFNESLI
uniref:Ubiquitin-like protease family profile domain-containing protein n=1 Tax=viral metagenome TaxID=1070528 RepID=A0A6C0IFK3_9ZZZZ